MTKPTHLKHRTTRNILAAFIINLAFSIFEFIGGMLTNSVAIFSDAVHDLGDAVSIGLSYVLERKSHQRANQRYTYGYTRFSILGGFITTVVLTVGSIFVIINAVGRFFTPETPNYDGMLAFAVFGVIVNGIAAYVTHKGDSINQKAVNLHMLEDVLGWVVVLVGAVVMKFTDLAIIDPLMSIGVALFILINALRNIRKVTDIFLERTPANVDLAQLDKQIRQIKGVDDVHHVHVWSIDGHNNYATMHIVTTAANQEALKAKIRSDLEQFSICHTTLELEPEPCADQECHPKLKETGHHH